MLPDLRFTWKTNLPQTKIQIASDPGFTRIIVNEPVRSNSFRSPALTAGTYYWRIASDSAQTPPRRFTVSAFNQQSPAAVPPVGLSAVPAPAIATPSVFIPPEPEPAAPLPTPVAAVVPPPAPEPPVAAPVPEPSPPPVVSTPVPVAAAVPEPVVAPEDRILPAALNRWPDDYTIGPSDLRMNRNILFSWDPVPGAEGYIITLFQEESGGNREIKRIGPVTETYYVFDELSLLDTGNFIWQLEAVSSTGRRDEETAEEEEPEEIQRGVIGESRFTVQFDPPAAPELKPPGVMYGR
jgi:hypothetical protein